MTTVAVGDIGTNTVRLLVAEVVDGQVTEHVVRTDVVGLGQGMHATGFLGEEPMARAVAALSTFRDEFSAADRSVIVATSASRDARNRDDFFDAVELATSVRPTLISGEQEAGYAFSGASQAFGDECLVVLDIGGGSTEFVYGCGAVEHAVSFDVGSVRLTDGQLGPAPVTDVAAARQTARSTIAPVTAVAEHWHPTRVVGVAGTCTTVAGTVLGLKQHDRNLVHTSRVSLAQVQLLVDDLVGRTVDEIADIGTIGPKRAPVILGGALILEAALAALDVDEMVVSEHDLLHGVALVLGTPT